MSLDYFQYMSKYLPYKVEYIPSDKSQCFECRGKIKRIENIRIGKIVPSHLYDGTMSKWFHILCIRRHDNQITVQRISNLDNIRWDDQQLIREIIGGNNALPKEKINFNNDDRRREQNVRFFQLRDQLNELSDSELIYLMEYNSQFYPYEHRYWKDGKMCYSERDTLLNEVTDRMLFGKLDMCDFEHSHAYGYLVFEPDIGYKCKGKRRERARCLNIIDRPGRSQFKLTWKIREKSEFLQAYECQIGERLFFDNSASAVTDEINETNNTVILRSNSEIEAYTTIFQNNHGEIYSKLFIQTDLQLNINKYYHLEIRKHLRDEKYWLLRRWGRIGTHSDNKMLEPLTLDECREKYQTKVSEMKNYIEMDIDINFQNRIDKINSTPTDPIEVLMKLIYDKNILKEEFMNEFHLDLNEIPIVKVSERWIGKAGIILEEIRSFIVGHESNDKIFNLIDKSNEYYSHIPHAFGNQRPPIIDDLVKYEKELIKLNSLIQMNVPRNFNNPQMEDNISPLEIFYRKLNIEIEVLNRDHEHFQIIQQYVKNTHSPRHNSYKIIISEIFSLKKHGNYHEKYEEQSNTLGNKKWLWHGTNLINIPGILLNDFRILPPEAHITGVTFGQGIYFTDIVSKAAKFSGTKSQNSIGILLLCEVALGKIKGCKKNDSITINPDGYDSILSTGNIFPNPLESFTIPGEIEVPCGTIGNCINYPNNLHHNEYVIYDSNQVKLKYLVQVEYLYDVNKNYNSEY
ncbi:poly [ADP-ribose] polymerase 1-like isoform X2 [Microplitis mediator]|uniref:poly [ADP-ribose] polymerase 1-like isoform X2 n=1 Tax=Microplitis mediator TaxID=375433 RepID=UPI0025575C77|nr:poly [ADP-ribose] polymerase 1-like isoform X2 [Microplitis mediator]